MRQTDTRQRGSPLPDVDLPYRRLLLWLSLVRTTGGKSRKAAAAGAGPRASIARSQEDNDASLGRRGERLRGHTTGAAVGRAGSRGDRQFARIGAGRTPAGAWSAADSARRAG